MESESRPSVSRIEISWKTIFKVLSGVLLAFVAMKLWPLAKLLIVSILVAVPLYRVVLWLGRKGWPRWAGLLVASLGLVFAVLGFAAVVVPVAVSQATNLVENLPKLKQQVMDHLPRGALRNTVDRAAEMGTKENLQRLPEHAFNAAVITMGGLLDLVLAVALVVYLMIDGPRALQWLVAYFPKEQRPRVVTGLENIGNRMVSFIIGQSMISGMFALYVLTVLSVLRVPMAVLLAVLAGLLDVVPVLGISISLVLGTAIGFTVSPSTGLLVAALYGAYHIFENYFLLPKVYGKKLRLSTLAVLLSMIAGGMAAGIVGAVVMLPLVAAYPALEKLWLAPQLEPEVVKDHQKQLRAA